MQKDVIYIDVEDDITAIIGKVKSAKHKIVALVPPKRIGVLQSAVNLRLINRAATSKDRRLVLISNNQALAGLAASAGIPVAKTLQSKPELAPISAISIEDDNEIIDGSELPIGDHARQSPTVLESNEPAAAVAAASLAGGNKATEQPKKATPPPAGAVVKPKAKRGSRVPNFNTFRKKLILVGLGLVLLIAFLVWAIGFAPRAKVMVATRTTDAAVNQQVNIVPDTQTSISSGVIQATTRQTTDDVSIEFEPSGERNVGERATGTVTITVTDWNRFRGGTIPAGTTLTSSSGAEYTTDAAVEFTIADFVAGNDSKSVAVTAVRQGADYNGASGSVSGTPRGTSARFDGATAGGTDEVVSVVTQSDVDAAAERARQEVDQDEARQQLESQFGDGYIVLAQSLQADTSKLESSVKVGDTTDRDRVRYGGEVSYTIFAIEKSELDRYLTGTLEQQIDDTDRQRVYESGIEEVQFNNVDRTSGGLRATISTNGKIGPTIDENEVKEQSADKRIGDIKSSLESISGVESVDVELWPFWVTKAPSNTDRIIVDFEFDDE